jgi:hypothetical protein
MQSLGLLTTHLIQVRNWIVSSPSVFTGLENIRSEPTNHRSRASAYMSQNLTQQSYN